MSVICKTPGNFIAISYALVLFVSTNEIKGDGMRSMYAYFIKMILEFNKLNIHKVIKNTNTIFPQSDDTFYVTFLNSYNDFSIIVFFFFGKHVFT